MGRKILFLLLGCLLITGQAYSQVGVNTETPNKLTEMEVTNLTDDEGNIIPKGVMVPRMTEAERDAIDVSDAANANSLLIYNTDEDCYNYYSKIENDWQSLCGKMGKAQFTIICEKDGKSNVGVYGDYGDGIALNTSHYIKVTVDVTKIGSYSIMATADPDNGYFYEASGTFLSLGTVTLTIPGTGEPVNHTQGADLLSEADDTPDQFTITSNGSGDECGFEVKVRSTAARPQFDMVCSGIEVLGAYFEDVPADPYEKGITGEPNIMKVKIRNIPPSAYGSIAVLETNTVDGLSFKGQKMLSGPDDTVDLLAEGTPRGLNDKVFTITSNSETSGASCTATVYMLIPPKRLLTIGLDNGTYTYNLGDPTGRGEPKNSGNDMLTDKNNFGYNQWSIVKFAGFKNLGTAVNANRVTAPNTWTDDGRDIVSLTTAVWHGLTGPNLETLLAGRDKQAKIDIIMIGHDPAEYFRNNNADDQAKAEVLVKFVKSGGILMICSEREISNGNFMRLFFGKSDIGSAVGAGAGSLYTLGFNSANTPDDMKPYYCKDDDPILKGPFEDIVGRHWGEDSSSTRYVTNLPLDEVIIYSGARQMGNTTYPAEGVTVFRHREYPFVFVGDGGFNSNEVRTYAGLTACPFTLTSKTINGKTFSYYPTYKRFGNASGRAYNAVFTANAFAWCIYKAEDIRRANK